MGCCISSAREDPYQGEDFDLEWRGLPSKQRRDELIEDYLSSSRGKGGFIREGALPEFVGLLRILDVDID